MDDLKDPKYASVLLVQYFIGVFAATYCCKLMGKIVIY